MSGRLIAVEASDQGMRLDNFISEELDITRSAASNLVRGESVTVNGKPQKCGYTVRAGDQILAVIVQAPTELIPENIPLDILFEDEHIAVINKPQGMAVHPGGGAVTGTLANAILYRFRALSQIGGAQRPGIVHRLDKDTSGVMVVAKTNDAHANLSGQFASHSLQKIYHAIVEGNPKNVSGEIKTLIGRDPKNRKLMAVAVRDGREAVTRFRVLESFQENAFVEFQILTGRTHQIRVHAKYMGHPIVGDPAYGFKKQKFNVPGQLLHAYSLHFSHPLTKEELTFTAPVNSEFERVLKVLRSKAYEV